jgi:LacI family transcriptional regulator
MKKQISINEKSDIPKVKQIEEQLRGLIQSEALSPGQKLPSMRQFAQQLGVSVGIAKQALNTLTTEGFLRSEDKIGLFVAETKPRRNIALVLPSVELEQIPRIVKGARKNLPDNFRLLIEAPSSGFYEGQLNILKGITKPYISGIILLTPPLRRYAEQIKEALDPEIPCVQSSTELEDLQCDSVTLDGFAMGETTTRYLTRKGHRKIGLITDNADSCTFLNRIEGMDSALHSINTSYQEMPKEITCAEDMDPDMPWKQGKLAALRLLKKYPDLTAIIGGNGHITLGILQAVNQIGKSVPDDISLIAMELDLPSFEHTVPPITALDKPFEQIFNRSVKLLTERMDAPEKPIQAVHLAPVLKERASVKTLMTD